jgi:hypothetical protein
MNKHAKFCADWFLPFASHKLTYKQNFIFTWDKHGCVLRTINWCSTLYPVLRSARQLIRADSCGSLTSRQLYCCGGNIQLLSLPTSWIASLSFVGRTLKPYNPRYLHKRRVDGICLTATRIIKRDCTDRKRFVGRSEWPRGLRRSAAAWLLGSRVRIPLGAWMFVCCVVLCR